MKTVTRTVERSNALSAEGSATLRGLELTPGEERFVSGFVALRCDTKPGLTPGVAGMYTFRRPSDLEGREAIIVADWGDWVGVYNASKLDVIEELLRGLR